MLSWRFDLSKNVHPRSVHEFPHFHGSPLLDVAIVVHEDFGFRCVFIELEFVLFSRGGIAYGFVLTVYNVGGTAQD